MLIRIDRSSFAFVNELKSEKFNENLTDARIDFQPIDRPKNSESDRSILKRNTEFCNQQTPIIFIAKQFISK